MKLIPWREIRANRFSPEELDKIDEYVRLEVEALSKMDVNLFVLQDYVKKWNDHNFHNKKSYQCLLGAGEELGELMHAHLKEEQGIRGTSEEHRLAKMDAIGDVLVYLADYCNQSGIQMDDCWKMVWEELQSRDWKKFPKNGKTE